MPHRTLKVGLLGTYQGYTDAFMFRLMRHCSPRPIEVVDSLHCDLLIVGPFAMKKLARAEKRYRSWGAHPALARLLGRQRPAVLMHLSENLRPDFFPSDYIISFDFCAPSPRQIRFPYWMEMLDWSGQGLEIGASNPRYGRLLSIERLMQPLGSAFLKKPRRAAIFSSHRREPRNMLIEAVRRVMPVDGFGAAFDAKVKDHSSSGFEKLSVLSGYGFNLCPENSLYPGYYSEKIPEAFHADCLPLTWADPAVRLDFNPHAFVNLALENGYDRQGLSLCPALEEADLERFAGESLLRERPQIAPLIQFIETLLADLA